MRVCFEPDRSCFTAEERDLPREALAAVAGQLPVGTFHPLLAVLDPARAVAALRAGALVAVEGNPEARELGVLLARCLGAEPLELPAEAMALYHLAAVFASNHPIALLAIAGELLGEIGLAPEQARRALLPLIRSTVENLSLETELAASLTGPIRRGDPATVQRHLELLAGRAPELGAVYRGASLELVRLVRSRATAKLAAELDRLEALLRGPER